MFRESKNKMVSAEIQQKINQREKLVKQNLHPSVTNTDRQQNEEKITNLNKEIETTLTEARQEEEERIIKAFRINSHDFYKYANKF